MGRFSFDGDNNEPTATSWIIQRNTVTCSPENSEAWQFLVRVFEDEPSVISSLAQEVFHLRDTLATVTIKLPKFESPEPDHFGNIIMVELWAQTITAEPLIAEDCGA